MKKIGIIVGVSFLAGALFFALTFGYLQKSPDNNIPVLTPSPVQAESLREPVKVTGLNFAPLVKRVKPAVVKVISTSYRRLGYGDSLLDRFFDNQQPRQTPGVGSGFIISTDGFIITNNHVVDGAVKVQVKTFDGNEYKAEIIGVDPKTDLALIKIKAQSLAYIELGDSDAVEVGEWVLAIGNPLNQDLTVTSGIISAKGRQLGLAQYEDFLQTDASINQGNSGGPLINMEGRVIGINSAILAPSGGSVGLGFAIPSNMAQKVIKDLKGKGRVVRGYLGVNVDALSESDAKELDFPQGGLMVSRIEPNSPAEKAGLKRYDLIVKVGGQPVKKFEDLSMRIAELSPGDKVELEILRQGQKKVFSAVVEEAPDTEKLRLPDNAGRSIDLGLVLVPNNNVVAREFGLKTSKGILVREVEPDSVAARNGFRKGDVLLEANGSELRSVDDFRTLIARKKAGSTILFYVNRFGEEGNIKFRLPEEDDLNR